MPESDWYNPILESFTTQTANWFVGVVLGLLTLFSSKITESIKFALNKADQRAKYYEEFAVDISEYIFDVELCLEYILNDWTTADSLIPIIKAYNESITKLRKKEYVYTSWLERYWNKRRIKEFAQLMDSVKTFDKAIRSLNREFEEVNIEKSKPKIDANNAKIAVALMQPTYEKLKIASGKLLTKL